jgi:hypothetical protein
MNTASEIACRELDHRSNNGIDVRLLWNSQTNRVWVAVKDERRGEAFELAVRPGDALDAFRHPYAYHAKPGYSAHADRRAGNSKARP